MAAFISIGCGGLTDPDPDLWDGNNSPSTTNAPAIEATATYAVALGGVADGRNELVIYNDDSEVRDFSGQTLEFETDNGGVELLPRPGFNSFADGSGALITPKKAGITIVSYTVDDVASNNKYKVIVPPQSLVQILMGEARGEIADEAQIENGRVTLESASPTGNAVGAIVRNRVLLLEAGRPMNP